MTTKVLYLIGKGRGGGTLLNNVLGQIPGIVAPGELTRLWTWGLTENWLCGCGLPVKDCPFWSAVMRTAFPDVQPEVAKVVSLQDEFLSWRKAPQMLMTSWGWRRPTKGLQTYAHLLERIYSSLAQVASARVIVESTRWPTGPTPLRLIENFDIYILNLVRDPRAVAFSWKRTKYLHDRPGSPPMRRFGSTYSMASLWGRSALGAVIRKKDPDRFLTIRYEDFTESPNRVVSQILSFVGEETKGIELRDRRLDFAPTHTVGGNPIRMLRGKVEIVPDNEWQFRQTMRDRLVVTALALPFIRKHGYELWPRREERTSR